MTIKAFLPLVCLSILFSFCSEKKTDKPIIQNDTKSQKIDPNLFLGNWKSVDADSTFVEVWNLESGEYRGMGYSLSDGLKTNIEYLKLSPAGDGWIYGARVTKQNGNNEIQFPSVEQGEKFIKFSNPEHDDPKSIMYTFLDEKEMNVVVEGPTRSTTLRMKKAE